MGLVRSAAFLTPLPRRDVEVPFTLINNYISPPVGIDKELSAIVEGDLLSPILPSATIDKRNLHKVTHGKNMKTPNWGRP